MGGDGDDGDDDVASSWRPWSCAGGLEESMCRPWRCEQSADDAGVAKSGHCRDFSHASRYSRSRWTPRSVSMLNLMANKNVNTPPALSEI